MMTGTARDWNVWGSVPGTNERFFSRNTMSPAVPQEIVDQILDFIPDIPDGLETLRSASLVCRSFRPSACTRLFQRIDLRDSDSEPTKLDILLQTAPHLLQYVRVLRAIGVAHTSLGLFGRSTALPTSLKALRNEGITLRRIELQGIDWKNMSSGMQAALLDLLACASLSQVRLHDVSRYPAKFIDHLPPAVKSLHISHTNIQLSKIFRRLVQLETLTIRCPVAKYNQSLTGKVLQTPAERVTRLRSLELSTCDTPLWPVYRAIIQHASSSLEELYILVNITAEHFNSVDLGRLPRIRKIVITPRLHSWLLPCLTSFRAAIVWLSQSLSNMPHDNNIDQVTIRFCIAITHGIMWYAPQFDAGIEKAAWESLDKTLSQPSFASSKTFQGMNLQICSDTQDIYDYLIGLAHANLPRMERSKKLHVTKERFSDIRYGIELP